jgi:hypothetical protein
MDRRQALVAAVCVLAVPTPCQGRPAAQASSTREFEVRNDRAFLGGHEVRLWGLRCGNALMSDAVAQRLVFGLDCMAASGINLVSIYLQAANGGHPDLNAGKNAFTGRGDLKPEFARRLAFVVREADARGMVVLVTVLCPLKDQELEDEAALEHAVEESARCLEQNGLRNVFVDLMYEFDHPSRIDHDIYREPDGADKKARVAAWFHAIAPRIEVGVSKATESKTPDEFQGMDVRLIQKKDPIPDKGFVVNIEAARGDAFKDDGVYSPEARARVLAECERFQAAPNACMVLQSAFVQGITGGSGTAPHFEPGGQGTGPEDRGIRFYYDWVEQHVGRWVYPRHVPAAGTTR